MEMLLIYLKTPKSVNRKKGETKNSKMISCIPGSTAGASLVKMPVLMRILN